MTAIIQSSAASLAPENSRQVFRRSLCLGAATSYWPIFETIDLAQCSLVRGSVSITVRQAAVLAACSLSHADAVDPGRLSVIQTGGILKGKFNKPVTTGMMTHVLLASVMCVAAHTMARADEAEAKKLLKGMSDYVASEKAISFNYDAGLEVVTKEDQRLSLLSSGSMVLNRPDKVHFTRSGGFADIEGGFDGKTLTLFGKNANIYVQADNPGSFDKLVNDLQEKFKRPLPAADLLLTNSYDELMSDVTDVKDLGSAVIGGVECDYLAFRKKDVDFQIWIAQGSKPYPCRFTIASRAVTGNPQYSIQLRDWKTGADAAKAAFTFENTSKATKVDIEEVREKFSDLPSHFKLGDGK